MLHVGHLGPAAGHALPAPLLDISSQPWPHKPVADQSRSGMYPWVHHTIDGAKHLLPEVLGDHRLANPHGDVVPHREPLHLDSYQVMRPLGM